MKGSVAVSEQERTFEVLFRAGTILGRFEFQGQSPEDLRRKRWSRRKVWIYDSFWKQGGYITLSRKEILQYDLEFKELQRRAS